MPRPRVTTPEKVIEALITHHGLISVAARALGISDFAIRSLINSNPDVKAALDRAREVATDNVESALMKKVADGDTAAIIFYLKTQGRRRGYSERMTIDADTTIRVIYDDGNSD